MLFLIYYSTINNSIRLFLIYYARQLSAKLFQFFSKQELATHMKCFSPMKYRVLYVLLLISYILTVSG